MSVREIIQRKLQSTFDIHCLEVMDESASHQTGRQSETHFRILIVSKDFEGLSMVQRHRKVYQALSEVMKNSVHALSQQTFTLKEWQAVSPVSATSPPCHRGPGHKLNGSSISE